MDYNDLLKAVVTGLMLNGYLIEPGAYDILKKEVYYLFKRLENKIYFKTLYKDNGVYVSIITARERRGLDKFLRKKLIRASVGDVISEIFYTKTTYNSFGLSQGSIIHYRLGFNNVEKFCKYMELDNYYVKLCGVPDRILLRKWEIIC
jgi:hypothetical protein